MCVCVCVCMCAVSVCVCKCAVSVCVCVCVCHANGVLSRVFTCDCGRTFRREGDLTRLSCFCAVQHSQ